MTAITAEVERLVPSTDDWPLMRGLLVGVAVGAAAAGLFVAVKIIQERRAARRIPPRYQPPPTPPLAGEASPL
jgi:uncharacterized integral membrane protein